MPDIQIKVSGKIAACRKKYLVSSNANYTITFDFDEEWSAHTVRTARFVFDSSYTDVAFSGNTVAIPKIPPCESFGVGVYSDSLASTTADIGCVLSVKDLPGEALGELTEGQYESLLALINSLDLRQIERIERDEDTLKVHFTDSTTDSFPLCDGVSVINASVEADGALILYLSDETTLNAGNVCGAKGDTPTFSIGTVTTVDSDGVASVTMTGTPLNPVLNFSVPRGKDGISPTITTALSPDSTNNAVPSAKCVYNAIQSAIGNAPVFEYLTEETTEEIPCTGLTLEPDILSFSGSGQQTIVATALPADTTDSVTWLSSDKNVATVSNGIVTAVGNGDCTITATCGSQSASCSVNVSGISTVVSVTGVTLDKATANVDAGSTVILTATIEPSNASNQNISWSSDNETVATVENGTVTGVSAGTATIGVMTEDGGYSAVCNVTVNEAEVSVYRNLFDKDTMVTANQGIPSTGVIGSYDWGLARVPVQENSQYSYKTVEDYADNERTYYGGATAGCIGFADSNGEIISRLSFAITQAQLDATDNNGLNCLLRDYTHGEIPEGEAYPKGFGWVTFTTPAGCAYLLFNTTLKNNADKIQLEAGDTIHNYYLPYSGGVE